MRGHGVVTMKVAGIKKELAMETLKHETAIQIRTLLDELRNKWPAGKADFDDREIESSILELVSEDD